MQPCRAALTPESRPCAPPGGCAGAGAVYRPSPQGVYGFAVVESKMSHLVGPAMILLLRSARISWRARAQNLVTLQTRPGGRRHAYARCAGTQQHTSTNAQNQKQFYLHTRVRMRTRTARAHTHARVRTYTHIHTYPPTHPPTHSLCGPHTHSLCGPRLCRGLPTTHVPSQLRAVMARQTALPPGGSIVSAFWQTFLFFWQA